MIKMILKCDFFRNPIMFTFENFDFDLLVDVSGLSILGYS